MQGSSLVDIETHCVCGSDAFLLHCTTCNGDFLTVCLQTFRLCFCSQPQISEWSKLIRDISVDYCSYCYFRYTQKDFEGNDFFQNTQFTPDKKIKLKRSVSCFLQWRLSWAIRLMIVVFFCTDVLQKWSNQRLNFWPKVIKKTSVKRWIG